MGVLGPQIDIRSPFFRVTTDDSLILKQRVEMVLDTRPGTYWHAPEYGFAVDDLINAGISVESFARIAGSVRSALLADAFFRDAAISVAVKTAAQRPEGLWLAMVATIALPDGEPQKVPIELSAAGATVGV